MSKQILYTTLTLLLVLGCFHNNISAQPIIEWENNYGGSKGEICTSIQQTPDGGYIVSGYSASSDGDVSGNYGRDDFWLLKIDATGEIEWEKNFGGSFGDEAASVQTTSGGGYIISGGTISNDIDVSGNNGYRDYWIVKINAFGTILWEKTLGGFANETPQSIQQTNNGGYIITGFAYSNDGDVGGNNGASDFWIVKLTESGIIEWEKNLGGSGLDGAEDIQQTTDGGYIIAGYTTSSDGDVSGNNGHFDYWIVKLNETGIIEWEKNFGGSDNEIANSIQQTFEGGFIVAGYAESGDGDVGGNNGKSDYWIVKLDENGHLEWENNFGGSAEEDALSIQQTIDGGYITVGFTNSNDGDVCENYGSEDLWLIKLDNIGTVEWKESFGGTGSDYGFSVQQTNDEGYIIAGYSYSDDGDVDGNNGDSDYWIVKLAPFNPATVIAIHQCEDTPGSGESTFDLVSLENGITEGTGQSVLWYTDSIGANPITNPESYISGTSIIWVGLPTSTCYVNLSPITIAVDKLISGSPNLTGAKVVNQADSESYQVLGLSGAIQYEWIIPSGASIIGTKNTESITIDWESSDGGALCVHAVNNCGESEQNCMDISLIPAPNNNNNDDLFPNAITPNNDGVNDFFVIPNLDDNLNQLATRDLTIFNRWGDILFQAKPYNNDWSGTNQNGLDLPQGTYYYLLRVDLGKGAFYRGDITLLR